MIANDQAQLLAQAFKTLPGWHCVPCRTWNMTGSPFCTWCGRNREDATDEARWARFFAVDAEIVEDEDCTHEHVERDDDGLDGRWHVCLDCDKTVVPMADEDGMPYWEVIE